MGFRGAVEVGDYLGGVWFRGAVEVGDYLGGGGV